MACKYFGQCSPLTTRPANFIPSIRWIKVEKNLPLSEESPFLVVAVFPILQELRCLFIAINSESYILSKILNIYINIYIWKYYYITHDLREKPLVSTNQKESKVEYIISSFTSDHIYFYSIPYYIVVWINSFFQPW